MWLERSNLLTGGQLISTYFPWWNWRASFLPQFQSSRDHLMFPLKTKDALSWAISVSWIAEPLYLHYWTLRAIGAIQVQIDARERVQIQELPENWEDARDPHGKSPCDHRYRSFVGHSCVDHKTFSSCPGVQMQQLLGPPLPKLWCDNMFRPQKVNIRMDETTRSVPHTFQHLSIAVSQACEAFSRVVELGQITSIQKSKLFWAQFSFAACSSEFADLSAQW